MIPLKGISLIDKECDELVKPRYEAIVNKAMQVYSNDKKEFNLNAGQIQQLQEVFQKSLKNPVSYDDKMTLF